MATRGRLTVRTIAQRNREARALNLRKGGFSYDAIAAELGYADRSGAYRAIQRALARTLSEPADELRKLEVERLDDLWRRTQVILATRHAVLYQGADTGFDDPGPRLKAIEVGIRVMERRAKLLGLDAPVKTRVEVITEDVVDAEIKRLEAELGEREQHIKEGPQPPPA